MTARTPHELVAHWRADATVLRRHGAGPSADLLEGCAGALAEALAAAESELLTLAEASRITGYSSDHLGKLIKRGALTNHGRPHAPRVRRGELPKKAARAMVVPIRPLGGSFESIRREAVASVHPPKAG